MRLGLFRQLDVFEVLSDSRFQRTLRCPLLHNETVIFCSQFSLFLVTSCSRFLSVRSDGFTDASAVNFEVNVVAALGVPFLRSFTQTTSCLTRPTADSTTGQ